MFSQTKRKISWAHTTEIRSMLKTHMLNLQMYFYHDYGHREQKPPFLWIGQYVFVIKSPMVATPETTFNALAKWMSKKSHKFVKSRICIMDCHEIPTIAEDDHKILKKVSIKRIKYPPNNNTKLATAQAKKRRKKVVKASKINVSSWNNRYWRKLYNAILTIRTCHESRWSGTHESKDKNGVG